MSSVNLSWDADGTIDSYTIYRSESPMSVESLPARLAENVLDKTYSDTTVVEGTTYHYRVASVQDGVAKVSDEVMVKASAGDEYWDNVVALLHFDDALTDEKGGAWTVYSYTSGGVLEVTTTNLRFGTGALRHTGRDKALRRQGFMDSSTDAFTFEAFIYLDDLNGPIYDRHVLFSQSVSAGGGEQMLCIGLDGTADRGRLVWYTGRAHGISRVIKSASPCVVAQQWTHVALCFDGTTIRAFSNGAKVIEQAVSAGWMPTTSDFMVGMAFVPGYAEYRQGLNGYIDELRITKGVARYTANFTPPDAPFLSS